MAKAKSYRRQGVDIGLTRYAGTVSAVALESADSWGSLDLRIAGSGSTGRSGELLGIASVSGRENLAQAVTLRLLTLKGSLEALGHPQYGCRLTELIGRENNETNRQLARLYTLEALAQEPRIREVTGLAVDPVPGQPDTLRVSFSVLPIDDDDALSLALDVTL
ncbi:MAG TPA: GPW/gp25 family protein [Thermoanaerobaculia bacterium]|nr:GPW/gp25 family protein [Thermoanaerobaculia bacterium]